MKAFDTIRVSNNNNSKFINETSRRQYIVIDKKDSFQIPIQVKVSTQAISQQVRKPKVHIIKTKQPNIHIVQPKSKGVLGFDTGTEEWGSHVPIEVQQQNRFQHSFFNSFRNANIFHNHSNQISNQNANQIQHGIVFGNLGNPFSYLKQKFHGPPQPNMMPQQLPPMQPFNLPQIQSQNQPQINLLPVSSLGFQNHMKVMQSEQVNEQKKQSLQYFQNQSNEAQHPMVKQLEINKQNMQQSYVQPVQLENIPAAFQNQQHQSIGSRLFNFLKSFTNKNSEHGHQNLQKQGNSQKLGHLQSQPQRQQNNPMIIEKSEVLEYREPQDSRKLFETQQKIEESIVQEYELKN